MIRPRLREFFISADSARAKATWLATLAGSAVGYAAYMFGINKHWIPIIIAVASGLSLLVCAGLYVRFEGREHEQAYSIATFGIERKNFFKLAFAASVAFLSILGSKPLEAALINDRLRNISKSPNPQTIRTATHLIAVANSEGITLFLPPIEVIVAQRLKLADVLHAVVDNVNRLAISRHLQVPIPVPGLIVSASSGGVQMEGISAERARFDGFGPDDWVPPDMVAFACPIDSPMASPKSPGLGFIRLKSGEARLSMKLDGVHCKNVIFTDCDLVYHGAALILENTAFYDCKFEFKAHSLNCQHLAENLLSDSSLTLSLPNDR